MFTAFPVPGAWNSAGSRMESEKGGNDAGNVADADTPCGDLLTLDIPPHASSVQTFLESQQCTIRHQIEELHRLVVLQCQITGTNPLSQEMAAAVMGMKAVGAGKRYGESLTPKALKCLFNVFSIKDTITKKEAREISGLCGASVMQVREFFSLQRSRVRRLVHQAHEAPADKNYSKCNHRQQVSDETLQENLKQPGYANPCAELSNVLDQLQESMQADLKQKSNNGHSNSKTVEIAEALIDLMQKENTFSGQSQLAQFIMQAHQGPVLRCFISKGGLPLLSRWLSQAALEEQTSLLRILLKALVNLPLGSALPRQMSSLLQIVNKLRFYRAHDVASRARLLLSRWSKFLRSGTGGRIPGPTSSSGASQLHKRIREHDELKTKSDIVSKKVKTSENCGFRLDAALSSTPVETETASRPADENATLHEAPKSKPAHSLVLADRGRERRKVRLFEEAGLAVKRAKDADVTRSTSSGMVSRPLSADDIQKAKRRAYLLQSFSASKLQKSSTVFKQQPSCLTQSHRALHAEYSSPVPNGQESLKKEITVSEKVNTTVGSDTFLLQEKTMPRDVYQAENGKGNNVRDRELQETKAVSIKILDEGDNISEAVLAKIFAEKCSAIRSTLASEIDDINMLKEFLQSGKAEAASVHESEPRIIPWQIPPRIILDPRWSVASGEESTEKVSQSVRLNNEQEAIYLDFDSIPTNPGEPLERFSLFDDDTNVPEILLEAVADDSQERESPVASDYSGEHTNRNEEEAESKTAVLESTPGEHTNRNDEEAETKSAVLSEASQEEQTKNICITSGEHDIASTQPTEILTTESNETDHMKDGSDIISSCNQSEQENVGTRLKQASTTVNMVQTSGCQSDNKSPRPEPDKVMPLTVQELTSNATSDHLTKIGRIRSSSSKDRSKLQSSSAHTYSKSTQYKHNRPIMPGMEKRPIKTSILSDKVMVSVKTELESNKQKLDIPGKEGDTLQTWNNSSLRKDKASLSSKADNICTHFDKKEKSNSQNDSEKDPALSEKLPDSSQQARISCALPSHVDKSCTQNKGSEVTEKQLGLSCSSDLAKASPSLEKAKKNPIEENRYEPQVPLGINVADLSKEACLEMLRVVLQQLANSSGGSGADLELLAVFLKNPDLVYALTSAPGGLPRKELVALTEALKGHSLKGNMSTSDNTQAGVIGGSNSSEASQNKSESLDVKVSAVASLPHSSLIVSSNSSTHIIPQPFLAGQLATPQARPAMASVDQIRCRQVQSTSNADSSPIPPQQSMFYAADRVLPKTMDTGKEEVIRGYHQQSVGLLPLPSSVQNMGFLAASPRPLEIEGHTGRKPGFENAQSTAPSMFPALIRTATLSSYTGLSPSSVTESAGFRPTLQQAETKGPLISSRPEQVGIFASPAQQDRLDNARERHTIPFVPGPQSSVGGNSLSRDQGLVMVSSRAPDTTLRDTQQQLRALKEAHPRSDSIWKPDGRSQPLLHFPGTMRSQGQSPQVFEQVIRPAPPIRPPLPPGRPPTRPPALSSRLPPTSVPINRVTLGDVRWRHSAIRPDGETHPRSSWRA